MIDVGETQIVLNEWGSLHPTGYPLYVISGNVLTGMLRALGVGPLVAATLVSLLWGVLALLLAFILATRLGFSPLLAAGAVLLFGLTRTVWIHNVIAEIYSLQFAAHTAPATPGLHAQRRRQATLRPGAGRRGRFGGTIAPS